MSVAQFARGPDRLIPVFPVCDYRAGFLNLHEVRIVAQFRTAAEAGSFVDRKILNGAKSGDYLVLPETVLASQAAFGTGWKKRPYWWHSDNVVSAYGDGGQVHSFPSERH